MYNWLTGPLKKRVIYEIRQILYDHPKFRDSHENVVNKYSFEERPQRGVIVNNATAERIRLSADNYVGRLQSFCMLANIDNKPGTSIEWVRENDLLLQQLSPKRDIFPGSPGAYYLEITKEPDDAKNIPGEFVIDAFLTVTEEPLIRFTTTGDIHAQLSRDNILPNSVRLWLNRRKSLIQGVDFQVNNATGEILFLKETPVDVSVFADYRYIMPRQGPFLFKSEETNVTAIPGVVIAFGDRVQICDKQAIVVTDVRTHTAEIYGGKFETTFSLIAFSKDADDRERLSDYIIFKILERQNALGFEGIELLDISPGGEDEEVYNEATDEYFYDSSISLSFRVDWESHIPLPIVLQRAEFTSKSIEQESGYLDGKYVADLLVNSTPTGLLGVPPVLRRNFGFERIT
jgi:hypothetical protein